MDEGQKVKVQPLGIVRNGSENTVASGACNEVIGFEFKDGSLVPYEPVKTNATTTGVDKIWVHKTSKQHNYVYQIGDTLYWQSEEKALAGKMKLVEIAKLPKQNAKINFVKNLLVCGSTVFLFNNGNYKRSVSIKEVAGKIRLNLGAKGNGVALMRDKYDLSMYNDTGSQWKKVEDEQFSSILERLNSDFAILEREVKNKEYIHGACFLRYAVRLFDGSYINASQPVLVLPDTYYEDSENAGFWDASNVNFWLSRDKNVDVSSSNKVDGLSSPQIDIVRAMVCSTEFWYLLANSTFEEIKKVREQTKNEFKAIRKRLEDGREIGGLDGKHAAFYLPSFEDFMVYGNRMAALRERINFNGKEFDKKKYYNYDFVDKKLTYGFDTKLSSIDREKGWTWGTIPPYVPFLPLRGESGATINEADKLKLYYKEFVNFLMLKADEIGQEKLSEYAKKIDKENIWRGFSEYAFRHNAESWYYSGENNELPNNYHIGEMGFGLHNLKFPDGEFSGHSNLTMFFGRELYTPVYELLSGVGDDFKDLVRSVDIFMTTPVSMHEEYEETSQVTNIFAHRPYKPQNKLEEELRKTLGAFYKIHSIPYEELVQHKSGKVIYPYIQRGKISSLEVQPTLKENGRNVFDYSVDVVYNNKLHIANIVESYDNMYKDCISDICSERNGFDEVSNSHSSTEEKLLAIQTSQAVRDACLKAMLGVDATRAEFRLLSVVSVKVDGVVEKMCYEQKIDHRTEYPFGLSIFYPDYNAEEIELVGIEVSTTDACKWVPLNINIGLTILEASNFAYNLNFDGKNRLDFFKTENLSKLTSEPTTKGFHFEELSKACGGSRKRDGNIFKVSETNQPLVFPYASTYRVGFGNIIGFSTNAVALSQGQFGAYPLYVFTDEGIFAMAVDTSGVGSYTSNSPLSREVCTNVDTITQVDGGVFFASEKGLMLLSGDKVTLSSEMINGEPKNLPNENSTLRGDGLKVYANATDNAQLVRLKGRISKKDFRKYLNTKGTHVDYIYVKNKLIVYNPEFAYCYLIDLDNFVCTKLAKRIKFSNGDYPNPLFSVED